VVFGPGKAGARLESSKSHAKEFMDRHRVPTARFTVVEEMGEAERALAERGAPVVVKASGLAAGKGVTVAESVGEARAALHACLEEGLFGEAGRTVVLEEKLAGEEVSLLVITDGKNSCILPPAQDHKRALDGDQGPNTGGMGAYSPAPALTPEILEHCRTEIVEKTLAGLREEGIEFRGLLYVGLMLTAEGPRVLEYNVRFGDPETQAVLARWQGDLGGLLLAAAAGELEPGSPGPCRRGAALCVVAAAAGYPRAGSRGALIHGLAEPPDEDVVIFHAGTARTPHGIVTAGGRVLDVVGMGGTLPQARERAYGAIGRLGFEGMRYRRDLGPRSLLATPPTRP
jgi:phosphoribosylamine--glycine ligase